MVRSCGRANLTSLRISAAVNSRSPFLLRALRIVLAFGDRRAFLYLIDWPISSFAWLNTMRANVSSRLCVTGETAVLCLPLPSTLRRSARSSKVSSSTGMALPNASAIVSQTASYS